MSFTNRESSEYQTKMAEWASRLDDVLLDIPLERDVLKYMGQNTRERLTKLAKLAEELK